MPKTKKIKASTLVISLLVVAVVLISELGIALTVLRQRRASTGSNKSNQAFQTADKGIEETLYTLIKDGKTKVSEIFTTDCDSDGIIRRGDGYEVKFFEEDGDFLNCFADVSVYKISKLNVSGFDSGTRYQQDIKTDISAVAGPEPTPPPGPPPPLPPPTPFVNPCGTIETVTVTDYGDYTDINNITTEEYPVIPIGTQCWMGKNMNVGKRIDGNINQKDNPRIPPMTVAEYDRVKYMIEKYCYDNDPDKCTQYGGLYQYNEAVAYNTTIPARQYYPNLEGICPDGWHIPTDAEWHILEDFLKERNGTCDPDRTNQNFYDCERAGEKLGVGGITDFDAPGGGKRETGGGFSNRNWSLFWTSTTAVVGIPGKAYVRSLCGMHDGVARYGADKTYGHSVRCIKGEGYYSGKPVIYLYPESTQEVEVKIYPQSIAQSIPEYKDGWKVLAHPDGKIINLSDNKEYPYLFWDGQSRTPRVDKNQGFVVKSEEVDSFLSDKLKAQGLNQKEADEFIEFWAPRMKKKDYTYVYFMPQADYDKLVPMTINPQPDTLIRVYMLFKSLDEPITVQEQTLSAPARKGFTAVEWGGDLMEVQ